MYIDIGAAISTYLVHCFSQIPIMKVGTTNVISISDTTIKAADNCTCGWGTRTKTTEIIISTE